MDGRISILEENRQNSASHRLIKSFKLEVAVYKNYTFFRFQFELFEGEKVIVDRERLLPLFLVFILTNWCKHQMKAKKMG